MLNSRKLRAARLSALKALDGHGVPDGVRVHFPPHQIGVRWGKIF